MNQKGFAPTLIVLLIAIGIGGYLLYTNYSNNQYKGVAQNTPVTSQTPQVTSSSTPVDETADWKTYINKDINYTFQYPSSAEVSITPKRIFMTEYNYIVINNIGSFGTYITILPSKVYSVEGYPKTNSKNQQIFTTQINGTSVNGNEWVSDKGDSYIELKVNEYVFQINISKNSSETRKLVNKILSTFKFTQ